MDAKTIKLIILVLAILSAVAGSIWGFNVTEILDSAVDINDILGELTNDISEE